MHKAKRRLAFWLCYLAIVSGFTAPIYAQSCPGDCYSATSGCSCVGTCPTECWWLGGQWYCSNCNWWWAIKMYSLLPDGPNCQYQCCSADFLVCNLDPSVAPLKEDR